MVFLLSPTDLRVHLKVQISDEEAYSAIRVATGLLRSATRLSAWPDPVPDDLWAWGVELASLVYDNPTGRQSEEAGEVTSSWPVRRRSEILAAAAAVYSVSAGPSFGFPDATAWPAW